MIRKKKLSQIIIRPKLITEQRPGINVDMKYDSVF